MGYLQFLLLEELKLPVILQQFLELKCSFLEVLFVRFDSPNSHQSRMEYIISSMICICLILVNRIICSNEIENLEWKKLKLKGDIPEGRAQHSATVIGT